MRFQRVGMPAMNPSRDREVLLAGVLLAGVLLAAVGCSSGDGDGGGGGGGGDSTLSVPIAAPPVTAPAATPAVPGPAAVGTPTPQSPPAADVEPPAVPGETPGAVDGAAGAGADDGAAGTGATMPEANPVCELPDASEFQPNESVGGGGSQFVESDHFRVYGNPGDADAALNLLEAAHKCFVEDWCFRSPGLSVHSDDGPYYKFNLYAKNLAGAAGVMQYDPGEGISYLEVLPQSVAQSRVTVHEFGHALTLTEFGWVEQTRTGAWWETVANWVADTFRTSPYCEAARTEFGIRAGGTIINLDRTIGQSHMLIVSDQNYYEAWPFLTYLTHNPDDYAGLGRMAIPDLFRNHPGNNDTPLHVLELIAAPVTVQTILGRYWARMAYLDIGHPEAQAAFFSARNGLDFDSLDAIGAQTYRVKASRQPQYGGANIIPLDVTGGQVSVQVKNLGNSQPDSNFTATLSVRAADGSVRYVDLPDGAGETAVGAGEEASLVVVNTPDNLYQYDAFQTGPSSPESAGLNYEVTIEGAVPAS